ncbi:MAG: hypothetical protein ACM3UT_11710 [Chloroflexota bacterium]
MKVFAIALALTLMVRSVSVRVSLEEKETSVLALAHTLALFQYPEWTKVATKRFYQ